MTPFAGHTLAALEQLSQPLNAFVRDDDAGWGDEALFRLLDVMAAAGAPIDLAAIPTAVHGSLAGRLSDRMGHGALVGVHMHGLSHANHETSGRKCEFGTARSPAQQRQDLQLGWQLLVERWGDRVERIFTPPWNRCAAWTPGVLSGLGFLALSREHRAEAVDAIACVDVCLDWSRVWREGGAPSLDAAWARAIRDCASSGRPLGLMLHHAVMDDEAFRSLKDWLDVLVKHPALRWERMHKLLEPCLADPMFSSH